MQALRPRAAAFVVGVAFTLSSPLLAAQALTSGPLDVDASGAEPIPGEILPADSHGPSVIESMQAVLEREAKRPPSNGLVHRERNGAQGTWVVPSRKATRRAHSGDHYAVNKWGDTRMGIGFDESVDLAGVWVSGQAEPPAWTNGLMAIGYEGEREVGRTAWFESVGDEPSWFAIELEGVDRVELVAKAVLNGGGFYGLDDLTFLRAKDGGAPARVVLDFEDRGWGESLTGSGYGGLTWETGTGTFEQDGAREVHAPKAPPTRTDDEEPIVGAPEAAGGGATGPNLIDDFNGPKLCDTGACWLPPDTCGAAGLDYFIGVVNQNMSVYEKGTGTRVMNVSLQSFFNSPGSAGDPRVAFDHFENRWIVIACDFSGGIYLGYTLTSDPTGSWFKTYVNMSQGSDSNNWPDYPTLGFDQNGIYASAYMVGGNFLMSTFAIDKGPLLQPTPTLGTVSAWRQLPWEGAIHPAVTHGTPAGEYLVSQRNATSLRLRRVDPPLTSPTLVEVGIVPISPANAPPSAPALGSTVNLSAVGQRLMNAVFRNGSVWTAHAIAQGGRAAARWYEIDGATANLVQEGTVTDPELYFIFPSIAVNAAGNAVLAFSGSSANQWAACYFTGRLASDGAGEMAPVTLLRAGQGAYNHASEGTNRWGDYSLTCVDPVDDLTLWTMQEFARTGNDWGTRIGKLEFDDCVGGDAFTYCQTAPNSFFNGALISHTGPVSISANAFGLSVLDATPIASGLFYYGPTQIQVPFGDGFRCVGAGGSGTYRLNPPLTTDIGGLASYPIDFNSGPPGSGPSQITAGATWKFQFWYRDPMGPGGSGFNLSDGLSVTFCE